MRPRLDPPPSYAAAAAAAALRARTRSAVCWKSVPRARARGPQSAPSIRASITRAGHMKCASPICAADVMPFATSTRSPFSLPAPRSTRWIQIIQSALTAAHDITSKERIAHRHSGSELPPRQMTRIHPPRRGLHLHQRPVPDRLALLRRQQSIRIGRRMLPHQIRTGGIVHRTRRMLQCRQFLSGGQWHMSTVVTGGAIGG